MDELFIGSAICKMSRRGEILLPAAFRRTARIRAAASDVRLFVDRRDASDCLTVYDRAYLAHSHAAAEAAMPLAEAGEAAHDVALRRRFAFATPVEMQPHGLLALPPIVRSRLRIRDVALLVGTGHYFQIWDVAFVLEWGPADLVKLIQLHRHTPRLDGDIHDLDLPARRTPRRIALATQSGVSVQPLPPLPARPDPVGAAVGR